ncbi:MAG: beta galactosidase jelly roll domain-containing protein [Lentisphaeria bacterium]|nr:beta galactosidase jelly roll domain-containing protein [Lentisphaeria bacterium]
MNSNTDLFPVDLVLDGVWQFGYTPDMDVDSPQLPDASAFSATMPVPAYWDDELSRLRAAPFWSDARFNPDHRPLEYPLGDDPPDASTLFLLGVGWYRRRFHAPELWENQIVSLTVGGVKLEAWVWLNGVFLGHHLGHSTAFDMDLSEHLRAGADNELILAVANVRRDRLGCVIRGWKGFSGGITGPVKLHVARDCRLADAFVWLEPGGKDLKWQVRLAGQLPETNGVLRYHLVELDSGIGVATGTVEVSTAEMNWTIAAPEALQTWSDRQPHLYAVHLTLEDQNGVLDKQDWQTGFRTIARAGRRLLLNDQSIFLRGATEHGYYPETCTPPFDQDYYRGAIRRLREVGFNWLRFHTSVPSEPYLAAADELGMMIQVEPPVNFSEAEWVDILLACRNHPSVIIYCCGNEECLDDQKIEYLARMAEVQKELSPNGLFNPHEALRGIEYSWKNSDFGDRMVEHPYRHAPHRLERLKQFSDCIGQYAWGQLSYKSTGADIRLLDERMEYYERPLLSHENGIIGNYLDLSLAPRYAGTRIGDGMFRSLRRNLEEAGLLQRAPLYYRNSCAWAGAARKHNMESARHCRYVNGYDFLGGIDCHWHRVGYPCGVLNEFYELKPGDTDADILRYNGESILLMGWHDSRNIAAGETVEIPLRAAIYGCEPQRGRLSWALVDEQSHPWAEDSVDLSAIATGCTTDLCTATVVFPTLDKPMRLHLEVTLTTPGLHLRNSWSFWCWPAPATRPANSASVVTQIDGKTLADLQSGAAVLLLGRGPFPTLPTSFQPACAGRATGNLATAIADHPLLNQLPHAGWCDWQFAPLLNGGSAVVFNDLPLPFAPLLEVVSSFKTIRKQAALFEYRVGRGQLLVCTLNLPENDPGAVFLTAALKAYADSAQFQPQEELPADLLQQMCNASSADCTDSGTDQGFDQRAQVHSP